MHPILRNILAVIVGLFVGGLVNMGLIMLGGSLIPPPPGVDVNDIVSINAHIHEYSLVQIMVPFFAHALGTLVGAFVAVKIAVSRKMMLALIIGAFNLLGGIMAVRMIPDSPMWFSTLELVVAYIPMALLGWRLGSRKS